MHEHGSEERRKVSSGIGHEAPGNEGPLPDKRVTATELYKEEQDVQSHQGIRDQRNSSARAIVVTDWEHESCLLLISQLHLDIQERPNRAWCSIPFVEHRFKKQTCSRRR